jgi:hypothetical protein
MRWAPWASYVYFQYSNPPSQKDRGVLPLVQDLRTINQIVQTKHPVVPNPYILLSKIPYVHKWFSIIDLKDTFWACPLDFNGKTHDTLAKQVSERYLTCQKTNKQALRQRPTGGRNPGLWPFQSIQVDYTEMPKTGQLNYLLVIICHLTHWVKTIPLPGATAINAIWVLLEHIIPGFGVVEYIDSDNGSHFTTNVLRYLWSF